MKNTIITALVILTVTCTLIASDNTESDDKPTVKISTPYGNMLVELYNKTPLHRDNFLKLAKQNFYDNLLFHRVIEGFMIQGGDPESKGAPKGKKLGKGGPGYKIPAEFDSTLIHRKGAIAAARESDNVNPQKKSSGSQFYIVQGQVIQPQMLDQMEKKFNQRQINALINAYLQDTANVATRQLMDSLQKAQKFEALNNKYKEIEEAVKSSPNYEPFRFAQKQREAYTTVGGTPHLDGGYTVFGQVVEGLHVIDSIAAQPTDKYDRPLEDIPMQIEIVKL